MKVAKPSEGKKSVKFIEPSEEKEAVDVKHMQDLRSQVEPIILEAQKE